MSFSLDAQARQTLFVIKESDATRKVSLPRDWQTASVSTPEQLFSCLLRAEANEQRCMAIVGEEEFTDIITFLRNRGSKEKFPSWCAVVVCKDPKFFFKEQNLVPELVAVVAEKDFRKLPEFYLLGALRQRLQLDERGGTKIGIQTLEQLNEIFIDLSAERNAEKLLGKILTKACELTDCAGGSLFMVEEPDGEMAFKLKIQFSVGEEVVFQPIQQKVSETSICGYVALTGKLLNVRNAHELKPIALPQFAKSIDHLFGPAVPTSLLTLPMKNSRNEIIAILELANKKSVDGVVPFDGEDESLLASFGTQAATCMENVDLYGDIQRLFEGFIRASITAIESRDPSTGGHSERVAKICVALARVTTECEVGIYRSVRFKEEEIRELEYAAMLHDFGKIGVREEVLVKAKKLYPYQLEGIKERIKVAKAAARIMTLERRLKEGGTEAQWQKEYEERLQEVEAYWSLIQAANEPNILRKESEDALNRIKNLKIHLPDGSSIAILSDEEYEALKVGQGSLTPSERLEIESHVRHTYQFLKMIPWTKDFKHLTEIAYAHHEKLDGTGYPRGLMAHEIPIQSKIMTIADIYDALTAADRWYKEAVPVERAIEILGYEVNQGKLDPVLFELFVEKKVFEVTQPKNLTKVA